MNEHTVLCACLLQWVRWSLLVFQNLEEVLHLFQTEKASLSFPDSLSTRELTCLKHWAVTHQGWCLVALLVSPSPYPGWEAAVAHVPVPIRIPESLFPITAHAPPQETLCVPDTTQQTQMSILSAGWSFQQPEGRLHTEATRISGQPLALHCCWAGGQGWGQAVPAGAAQMWQNVAAGFVQESSSLCAAWRRLPGRISPCKVTRQDYLEQVAW